MQTEEDIILELDGSDSEPESTTDASPEASVSPEKSKSRFNLDHKQKGMLAMGAVAVLGAAVLFGPNLFSSTPQRHDSLKTVEQQTPDAVQPATSAPQLSLSDLQSLEQKDSDEIRSIVVSTSNAEIELLKQLLIQNQHNADQLMAALQKNASANAQSLADTEKADEKAKGALKHTTIRRVVHPLPAFKINTIFPNEAWLQLGSLTYCVSPGDVVKGVRIIAIDPDTATVTTSAGVIHR